MLLQQTLTALKHLKLTGMAQALEEQMAQPATQTLGFGSAWAFCSTVSS